MRDPGLPTLDQLRVFLTVIDTGGFAHAARHLFRTQSVISYTIANLEEQLNVVLFDRNKRKPTLTEAGNALLADARAVSLKVDAMRARAKALSEGLEAEVSLAVDVMHPTEILVRLLEEFQAQFPTVALRLRVEALGAVIQLVLERVCHIGISGFMIATPDPLERQSIGYIELVPVAAPTHPLALEPIPIPTAIAREHTQLVLTDRSQLTAGQNFGVFAVRDWRLADMGAKHALLVAGLGWGNMPIAMVRDDLASGRLVRLSLVEAHTAPYPLHLIHRTDDPPGPAGKWLMEQFKQRASSLMQPPAGHPV